VGSISARGSTARISPTPGGGRRGSSPDAGPHSTGHPAGRRAGRRPIWRATAAGLGGESLGPGGPAAHQGGGPAPFPDRRACADRGAGRDVPVSDRPAGMGRRLERSWVHGCSG